MSEISIIYELLKKLIAAVNKSKEKRFDEYIDDIFQKMESIVKNYFDIFSTIKINIVSGKFDIDNVLSYLEKREFELKETRILVRSFLKDKYYSSNETRIKFVEAAYGIMECYPVTNSIVIDKSNHTIKSYISFCNGLLLEDRDIQKDKIIKMINCILQDLTTSWETLCKCYKELKK